MRRPQRKNNSGGDGGSQDDFFANANLDEDAPARLEEGDDALDLDSILDELDFDGDTEESDDDWGFEEDYDEGEDEFPALSTSVDTSQERDLDDEGEAQSGAEEVLEPEYEDIPEPEPEPVPEPEPSSFSMPPPKSKTKSANKEPKAKSATKGDTGKKSALSGLMAKALEIKDAIAKDFKGENESSKMVLPEDEKKRLEREADGQGGPVAKRAKKRSKGRSSSPAGIVSKAYKSLANAIFKALVAVLSFLAKIPVLSILAKPLLSLVRTIKPVFMSLPALAVVGALVYIAYASVPSLPVLELPDSGKVSVEQAEYSDGQVSATVVNQGGTIADDLTVHAVVYTYKPGLNPLSWIMWTESGKCENTDTTSVEIDQSQDVSLDCAPVEGWWPRVSVSLTHDE